MSDIFHDIDEDLRRARYAALWARFGPYVMGLGVAVVLGIGGYSFYNARETAQREAASQMFDTALRAPEAERDAALARVAESASAYARLAGFHRAAALAQGGNLAGALEIYDRLAAEGRLSEMLRDLAHVNAALVLLRQEGSDVRRAIIARLEAPSGEGRAFRLTALELMAQCAFELGEASRAVELYDEVLDMRALSPQHAARLRALRETAQAARGGTP